MGALTCTGLQSTGGEVHGAGPATPSGAIPVAAPTGHGARRPGAPLPTRTWGDTQVTAGPACHTLALPVTPRPPVTPPPRSQAPAASHPPPDTSPLLGRPQDSTWNRASRGTPLRAPREPHLRAISSGRPLHLSRGPGWGVPRFEDPSRSSHLRTAAGCRIQLPCWGPGTQRPRRQRGEPCPPGSAAERPHYSCGCRDSTGSRGSSHRPLPWRVQEKGTGCERQVKSSLDPNFLGAPLTPPG